MEKMEKGQLVGKEGGRVIGGRIERRWNGVAKDLFERGLGKTSVESDAWRRELASSLSLTRDSTRSVRTCTRVCV